MLCCKLRCNSRSLVSGALWDEASGSRPEARDTSRKSLHMFLYLGLTRSAIKPTLRTVCLLPFHFIFSFFGSCRRRPHSRPLLNGCVLGPGGGSGSCGSSAAQHAIPAAGATPRTAGTKRKEFSTFRRKKYGDRYKAKRGMSVRMCDALASAPSHALRLPRPPRPRPLPPPS